MSARKQVHSSSQWRGLLQEEFLPAVLGRPGLTLDDETRALMAQAPKNGGLGFINPVKAAEGLRRASEQASTVLVGRPDGRRGPGPGAHATCVRAATQAAQEVRKEEEASFLAVLGRRKGPKVAKRLKRLADEERLAVARALSAGGDPVNPGGVAQCCVTPIWLPADRVNPTM